jgi:tetratricopeptide (TPR) repeat protein
MPTPPTTPSPWRHLLEDVRRVVGNRRDEHGVIGSINWLRQQMQLRGANPNVVRNIIYRDKGKPSDKRALLEILSKLWSDAGQPPLHVPELEPLLAPGPDAEQEVLQLLGREKRRVYRDFIGSVSGGQHPKLLLTGRPGSGKTLLTDYIQQALIASATSLLRLEFSGADLAASLARLARALGVAEGLFEAKLAKIGTQDAFSVQADAQADLARLVLEAVGKAPLTLLLHVSQLLGGQDNLGLAPLRLNTPEVPRVSASEWLWASLWLPMSRLPHLSLLLSMTEMPARALSALGGFTPPVKLAPPSASEARRFVKACLPDLAPRQQEALVQRAGRSFEELRTLTLLAEIRTPPLEPLHLEGAEGDEQHIAQLGHLLETGAPRLRDFLAALAAISLPEFPDFQEDALLSLREPQWRTLSSLEQAFLDNSPGTQRRCFSRQLLRRLRERLTAEPLRYQALHAAAAHYYQPQAEEGPQGEDASRYLHHLFEAREWSALERWMAQCGMQQSLLRRLWRVAPAELSGRELEAIARQVAANYVKLGSYDHPGARSALAVLTASAEPEVRAWTALKRAEGAVIKGHYTRAEALLADWPQLSDPTLNAEVELVRASIARWRSRLADAAELVAGIKPELPRISTRSAAGALVHVKVAVWAGLIAKDQGDLTGALAEFDNARTDDDLIRARVAFQKGDVQMQLGRFSAALAELDEAVRLSRSSEAPAFEQARYLARRGTLQRYRGEWENSSADLAAALECLQEGPATENLAGERTFERAKVDDERTLTLLALGRAAEAVTVLQRNLETFASYQREHQVDASFRLLRSRLRLSLAYGCRGLGRPWRLPPSAPSEGPDGRHAETLIRDVLADIEGHPEGQGRYGPLHRQALLAFSLLAADPQAAAAGAQAALEQTRFPYQEAHSRAHLAAARRRGGSPEEALQQVEAARGALQALSGNPEDGAEGSAESGTEDGDSGLSAWLARLTTAAWIRLGNVRQAGESLLCALEQTSLSPYHETLLRAFGEAVEDDLEAGWLDYAPLRRRLNLSCLELPQQSFVRLPDALLACWQARRGMIED